MESLQALAPTFPPNVLYGASGLFVAFLAVVLLRTRNRALQFLILAISLRYLMGVHHQVTFQRSPLGLSWNAVASAVMFLGGLPFLRDQFHRFPKVFTYPIGFLLAIACISAVVNGQLDGFVSIGVKYGFFLVVAAATASALMDVDAETVGRRLSTIFVIPIGFQLLSLLLGVTKRSESDGSLSVIGGYYHEGSLSVVLATLVLICFIFPGNWLRRLAFAAAAVAGILLANYRTVILAMLPLVAIGLYQMSTSRFVPRFRPVVGLVPAGAMLGILLAGGDAIQQRFSTLSLFLASSGKIWRDPDLWTFDERRMLSGRAYIWNLYINGYKDGTPFHWLCGFGPDAWTTVFPLYAHNTLVSYLYEFGLSGVVAVSVLWIGMLMFAWEVRGPSRVSLVAAHVSFIVLNMATMPHWQVEGLILYGLLCGATVAARYAASGVAPKSSAGARFDRSVLAYTS